MGDLPATEAYAHTNFGAFGQKLAGLISLDQHIMLRDLGAEPDFLDLYLLLGLARLALAPLPLIRELAIIEKAAYRRVGGGCDLYQVKPALLGQT